MPFSMLNTLASFQGYINKIFANKLDISVILYLNNIFIYAKDFRQVYIDAVSWVLYILWKHGLFANLKKCRSHKKEISFLSYVVLAKSV